MNREEFIELLREGLPHVDIARRLGVTHPLIARLIRQLSHRDLVAVAMARPVAYVPPVKVSTLTPVDVIGEVMSVLDELRHIRGFLASPDGVATFRNPSTRLTHQLQVLDRILRWAESFIGLRKQMAEWSGFEAWRDEMLAILEEEAPELRERLVRRIAAKVLVDRKPKAVEQPEPRRAPVIDPAQVPPSLRPFVVQMNAPDGLRDHGHAAEACTG